jgi:hypothetical protein
MTSQLDPSPATVVPLRAGGRRRRLVASALVVLLLLAGTAWGRDDDFPFGPFRMYATTQHLDGFTSWFRTEGVLADGSVVDIPTSQLGLRRAELEGQLDRFRQRPELLDLLITAYERRQPDHVPLVELRVVKHRQDLRDGLPVGEPTERVEVAWTR